MDRRLVREGEARVMFWLQALVAVAIVCGTVLVASGRGDGVSLPTRDEAPEWAEREGPIEERDLDTLQIGVVARGYRMDEVDAVLDRLGTEIGTRDARIAQLEHVLEVSAQVPAPTPAGLSPSAWDLPRRPGGVGEEAGVVPVEPVSVEPVSVEPVSVEPVLVEPVLVEPVLVEPVSVEPVSVKPADPVDRSADDRD